MLLHFNLGNHVLDWWVIMMGLGQGSVFEGGRLMRELMRRKCLGVRLGDGKGVDVLKVMLGAKGMGVEAMEMGGGCSVTGVYPTFRRR